MDDQTHDKNTDDDNTTGKASVADQIESGKIKMIAQVDSNAD